MKLSILDQSPVSAGMTAYDALEASVCLAQYGEELGYARYWIAEHHDLFGLACPNPSVMLGVVGSRTSTIRIGAGAVLLPYYKPFHVAETYNLLATLFPKRIDLGLGRAPGGSAEVSLALTDNYLGEVRKYPEQIDELQHFLRGTVPKDQTLANISPTPIPEESPDVWLLGTSKKSAKLAAEKGMHYAFAHFMTEKDGPEIVRRYITEFKAQQLGQQPYAITAISVICAETTEEAHDLALSQFLWSIRQDKVEEDLHVPSVAEAKAYEFTAEELQRIEQMKQKMIIGNPEEVKTGLITLRESYQAEEFMIVTIVHDPAKKMKSYQLVKEVIDQMNL